MPVAVALDELLATRTLWHAGRNTATGCIGIATGHAALDDLLPHRGWPNGTLIELLIPVDGVGELQLLLPLLARMTQAQRRVALVAPPYLPYAPAWQAHGVDLRHLEWIRAGSSACSPRDALWAFEQCLRSAACAVVLGWPQQADAAALRRLQVAAVSGDCLGFAFRDQRHAVNPSPAAVRIERTPDGWRLRKCRGSAPPACAFVPTAVAIH